MTAEPRRPSADVLIVAIPDNKEALYIDGQLVVEAQWISTTILLEKLVQRACITGGRRYADDDVLNDVGQFPRDLPTVRDRKFDFFPTQKGKSA